MKYLITVFLGGMLLVASTALAGERISRPEFGSGLTGFDPADEVSLAARKPPKGHRDPHKEKEQRMNKGDLINKINGQLSFWLGDVYDGPEPDPVDPPAEE